MRAERVVVALVASVLAVRVLGISLVLPGFPAHGAELGGTPLAVGVAFGAYGATMALLQVPFGALSDRWGRRPALALGLAVAAAGSLLAAWAPTVPWLVAARLLQGAGAVNGVAVALLADRVPEERRTTAMAWAGAAIGGAFTAGLVAGAALAPFADMPALFVANAVLNGLALVAVLAVLRPEPAAATLGGWRDVARATARPAVLALDAVGFAVNAALHAVLFAFPALAAAAFGAAGPWAFAGTVLLGGGLMFGAARSTDREAAKRAREPSTGETVAEGHGAARRADRGRLRTVAAASLVALPVGAAVLLVAPGAVALVAGGVAFFAAQATLTAALPSLLAGAAGERGRGAAQGSLQTAQYAGVAAGGALAGALVGAPLALAAAIGVACMGALAAFALVRRA